MELKKPPPVRRLTGEETIRHSNGYAAGSLAAPVGAPPAVASEPRFAGSVATLPTPAPASAPLSDAAPGFVAAPREITPSRISVDRMAIEDVSISYSGKPAVKNVSIPIRQGEVLALIGPSGCGKTTLLRSLNRLTELTRGASLDGRITLDGTDTSSLDPTELRRRVTMVFQQPNPFPMSVFDNVAYALREQGSRRPRKGALVAPVRDALTRAGLIEQVGDTLDHPALRLSGGQQQRLCIARALAANPEVLLLDEPCSALDPQSTRVIEDLIVKLREEVAVVIVTHNLQQAYRIADYVAFMYLGDLVEYGPTQQIFRNPREERTREYVSGAFG